MKKSALIILFILYTYTFYTYTFYLNYIVGRLNKLRLATQYDS